MRNIFLKSFRMNQLCLKACHILILYLYCSIYRISQLIQLRVFSPDCNEFLKYTDYILFCLPWDQAQGLVVGFSKTLLEKINFLLYFVFFSLEFLKYPSWTISNYINTSASHSKPSAIWPHFKYPPIQETPILQYESRVVVHCTVRSVPKGLSASWWAFLYFYSLSNFWIWEHVCVWLNV